ncbi:hypothetical protein Nepgr_010327 [Nepenthes gracilis]|uniref:Uncharacterized protein n=1 Tax=Nepenthes gracilis TaxID=150966 RepID=A0AAD3XKY9_NEPGR|nr:hypothetical protein Nepgr_010327 [Nepenthes gracilis]
MLNASAICQFFSMILKGTLALSCISSHHKALALFRSYPETSWPGLPQIKYEQALRWRIANTGYCKEAISFEEDFLSVAAFALSCSKDF